MLEQMEKLMDQLDWRISSRHFFNVPFTPELKSFFLDKVAKTTSATDFSLSLQNLRNDLKLTAA